MQRFTTSKQSLFFCGVPCALDDYATRAAHADLDAEGHGYAIVRHERCECCGGDGDVHYGGRSDECYECDGSGMLPGDELFDLTAEECATIDAWARASVVRDEAVQTVLADVAMRAAVAA